MHRRADIHHNKRGLAVTPSSAAPVWALPEAAALDRAAAALLRVQRPGGDWEDEMVWCTMVTSQWVMVQRIVNRTVAAERREGIIRYFAATRTQEGVWGFHPESPGYVFTTTLAYVALRLLGLDQRDDLLRPALNWLHAQPGGVQEFDAPQVDNEPPCRTLKRVLERGLELGCRGEVDVALN